MKTIAEVPEAIRKHEQLTKQKATLKHVLVMADNDRSTFVFECFLERLKDAVKKDDSDAVEFYSQRIKRTIDDRLSEIECEIQDIEGQILTPDKPKGPRPKPLSMSEVVEIMEPCLHETFTTSFAEPKKKVVGTTCSACTKPKPWRWMQKDDKGNYTDVCMSQETAQAMINELVNQGLVKVFSMGGDRFVYKLLPFVEPMMKPKGAQ